MATTAELLQRIDKLPREWRHPRVCNADGCYDDRDALDLHICHIAQTLLLHEDLEVGLRSHGKKCENCGVSHGVWEVGHWLSENDGADYYWKHVVDSKFTYREAMVFAAERTVMNKLAFVAQHPDHEVER